MNRSDFRVSGANKFNPNFSFSSSAAPGSAHGRARPRLAKLRKPKSSFVGQGAADFAYNPFRNDGNEGGKKKLASVFGWRSDVESVLGGEYYTATKGRKSGKEDNNSNVPDFGGACSSLDKNFEERISKVLDKLTVRDHSADGFGGAGNSSCFEFKGRRNGNANDAEDSNGRSARGANGEHNSNSFVFKSSFSVLDGSTENLLSEKMQSVRIDDRVGDSSSSEARDSCSSHENFKTRSDHENKENMCFRESDNPTNLHTKMGPTNCGSGLSSSSDPSSSAANFCSQHGTNFADETIGNKQTREGFFFTGTFEGDMSSKNHSIMNRKIKMVLKRHVGKENDLKKKGESARRYMESRLDHASHGQESVSKESSFQADSPQPYLPMDMSPNLETMVKNQCSNEATIPAEKTSTHRDKLECSDRDTQDVNHPIDEVPVCATQQPDKDDNVSGTIIDDKKSVVYEGVSEIHSEELVSVTETEGFKSAAEALESNPENTPPAAIRKKVFSISESDISTSYYSICNSKDASGTNFTFTASSPGQQPASVRRSKKISRRKGFDSTATSKVSNALSTDPHLIECNQNNANSNSPVSYLNGKVENNFSSEREVSHESSGTPATSTISQEACEKWRLRGNEAYANGDPSKAEEYYTRGVKCIPKSEKSRGCLEALKLCYSNRAATHMYLGQFREATKDCKLAAGIDPDFLKAHIRAGNCYLALGEVEEASKHFKYCLHSGHGVSVDKKILTEAFEGLQKAQKAAEDISRSIESVQRGTYNDAEDALKSADMALAICFYSEKLLEIKAEALFMLQEYNKVIQLCQESIDNAKRNSITAGVNGRYKNPDSALLQGKFYFMLWRCRLMLKSHFLLGKPEEALSLLEKHESFRWCGEALESLVPIVATIRELLRHKTAGNEAFQSGNYDEAIEHYTSVLSSNVDSRPFAAICFCNRAAAYKALGKIVDSIADCNFAIALEKDYIKAISRRASLYESVRNYGEAASDTKRIVSLLKERAKASHQISHEKSINSAIPIDLRQAQLQLSRLEEQSKKNTPLNMYLILGIKSSASAAEIKKAYRHAALKHHPDKAGQFLAKVGSRRTGTWKEIAEEIHRDADKLFKLIGEANTVLSDPAQRSTYDAEEEIRNMPKKSREPYSRTHVDSYTYYPCERSRSRRHWTYDWRRYGHY